MDPSLDSPPQNILPIESYGLITPDRIFRKRVDFGKLQMVQTPMPVSSNIFNQLLEASKHSSLRSEQETIKKGERHSFKEQYRQNIEVYQNESNNKLVVRSKKTGKRYTPKAVVSDLKVCNCSKSNCMKKYCDCYKAGVGCSEFCKCYECKNKSSQSKNIIQTIICKCKKSECVKNYCQCHQAGRECSQRCGCSECKNRLPTIETVKKRRINDSS